MVSLTAVEEIISRIIDNEGVEIAAVAVPDEKKGEKIVMLFSGDIRAEEVKQELLAHTIDPLMHPGTYVKVEAIPKLGTGKTDITKAKELAHDR
jgi:acyl-[acyl-carrier-protein]-phospholipid O-acyltransferase/long-chain-fatty-acid--[acyl-carrier-protein] ligase